MAAAAVATDLDSHKQRVLVAVHAHLDDALDLARSITLVPERLPGPRPIPCLPRRDRLGKRLLVHMRDHEHVGRRGIDGDHGDQSAGIEVRDELSALLDRVHGRPGPPPLTRVRKRNCSVGSVLNTPVKPVVTVETPCF